MREFAIQVENMSVMFDKFMALDKVSLCVLPKQSFGIVGESGSGKSTLLRAIAGLVNFQAGKLHVADKNYKNSKRDKFFYRTVQMVFQDPYGSLHPRQTVDRLLIEPLVIHRLDDRERRIRQALDEVGLGSHLRFRYTHQLSGGQRQRVAIARALIVEPKILLLDEPTSALDASIQAEILNLLHEMRHDRGLTFIMVSHDLGVISHMCDHLSVMHKGLIVETLAPASLRMHRFTSDYTGALLRASSGFHRSLIPPRSTLAATNDSSN